MSQDRAMLVLKDDTRAKAVDWCRRLPAFTRVIFKAPLRTLPQNDRLHAMLDDIIKQHPQRPYDKTAWKALFMKLLGKEMRFLPALDGVGFVPIGPSTSDLSVKEFSDLLELVFQFGAENNIQWSDPAEVAMREM
jgi:hypothetical protein